MIKEDLMFYTTSDRAGRNRQHSQKGVPAETNFFNIGLIGQSRENRLYCNYSSIITDFYYKVKKTKTKSDF